MSRYQGFLLISLGCVMALLVLTILLPPTLRGILLSAVLVSAGVFGIVYRCEAARGCVELLSGTIRGFGAESHYRVSILISGLVAAAAGELMLFSLLSALIRQNL